MTSQYVDLFHCFELDGVLDIGNAKQIFCLHLVFVPVINDHIARFVAGWDQHQLRTAGHHTPDQLFYAFGVLPPDPVHIDEDYGLDPNGPPVLAGDEDIGVVIPDLFIPPNCDFTTFFEEVRMLSSTRTPADVYLCAIHRVNDFWQ